MREAEMGNSKGERKFPSAHLSTLTEPSHYHLHPGLWAERWLNTLAHSLHFRSSLPSFVKQWCRPKITGNHPPCYPTVNLFLLSHSGPNLTYPCHSNATFTRWHCSFLLTCHNWAPRTRYSPCILSLLPDTMLCIQKLLLWALKEQRGQWSQFYSIQCDRL